MGVHIRAKTFVAQSLALSVTLLMLGTAQAATPEQQQIEELRQEIAQLKTLIFQQQQVQDVQKVQIQEVQAKAVEAAKPSVGFKAKTGADIKLYGSLRTDVNYIIDGADRDFNHTAALGGSSSSVRDKIRATPKMSRVGIDVDTTIEGAKIGGKVEVDFGSVTTDELRIRHAYLTYNNWLIGQTTSNFLSSHAPEFIDLGTPLGGGTTRVPLVSYTHKVDADTKITVSAEQGKSTATGGTIKYSAPVLTAKLSQGFAGDKGLTTARALVEHYKDSTVKDDAIAWGAALGVTYQLTSPLKLTADYSYVKGNSNYLYGSNSAYKVDGNEIEQNQFQAFQVGATYKITPKLRSTIGYGAQFSDDGTEYAKINATASEKAQHAWINFIYSPVKPIDLGIEYINGERETFAGVDYTDDRIGLLARYNF